PKSFSTACTVATQIMAQVSSNQYGGQSITIKHLAPFLRVSFDKYHKKYLEKCDKDLAYDLATERMMEELKSGVQTVRYQLSTLQTTNGQSPFATVYLEIIEGDEFEREQALICEEMIKQRLEGMKNYRGQEIGETFPKLIYVLDEHNCLEGGKYDYITELCAECNVKRLVPDYQSAKIMRQNYEGCNFPPMGCRSHLSPYKDENGDYKWYGRFNQGVISLNLPQIGIIANKDMDLFWSLLNERLELCKEALLCRHKLLLGTKSDVSPIHWQFGALGRLKKGEVIDELLKNNYSTLSLGYVGICELTYAMLGVSHTTKEGEKFALEVMNFMKKKCDNWKKEYNLGFGLYGTPAENLIYRFCRLDTARYGKIENVTDKMYYTNSYHVHVTEPIDAFEKLEFESQFHAISSGGCISYVEVPNLSNNLDAVKSIINFIYHNVQYAEINTKPDLCYKCGYTGEIQNDENLNWYCPNCGNRDESEMQVMRRTCGYIGSSYWSKGRTAEIKERVLHL
ncbi:MAG: anaerobic ribonucleoside-triphosphate reductase, partial [Clostridium sp.]|nr:anaerobic ribonucleoside-triphosphate reductase [Clostridium sp.]